jgi:predicted DNA-binding protein (MmcQ/YjbR family)
MSTGLSREALKALLDARPGVTADPYSPSRSDVPLIAMYKIMGKMFAILSLRGEAYVIVKCDEFQAEILRETYAGIGHRSHLDKRFWISIDLESDVPADEIVALVDGSYALIRAGLTRKQQAALDAMTG